MKKPNAFARLYKSYIHSAKIATITINFITALLVLFRAVKHFNL